MANQESAQGRSKGTVLDYQPAKAGATGVTLALLSAMMFLEFFIWGAWAVSTGGFMSANGLGDVIFWAYTVGPIAALVSPFFLGMIADRYFSSERVLAVMTLLSAVAMFGVAAVGKADGGTGKLQVLFIVVLGVHMLCFMPTLGLTNTVAFHNLTNQEKQFPLVRVFGTAGWIVAGLLVDALGAKSVIQYVVAGSACVVLGLLSFVLPHTPPPAKGQKASARAILGLDALSLMKSPSFVVFIISSFLICIPLAAYFSYANVYIGAKGFAKPTSVMQLGQGAEVIFMLIMPLCFAWLGVKWMLVVGMLAWVVRYGLFSAAATNDALWPAIIVGILLHGICYDFFFVTGFIYTDKKASKAIRGQAQGFLVLITQGVGMLIGTLVVGRLVAAYSPANVKMLRDQGVALATKAANLSAEAAKPLLDQAKALALQADQAILWHQVWLIPCVMAAVVMFAFFLLFKDDGKSREEA